MHLKIKNNIVVIIGELLDMMMILSLTLAFAVITGCGEENEESVNPLTANSLKQFEEAALAAPTAPNAGIPSVKEVGYYSDWKLTKNITDIVKPGSTIFLKVVFSEPMRLKVADDETARPILYYRLNGKLNRFRIAKHGAGGQDFVSGDAKPMGKKNDSYICKYIVPVDVAGELVAAVGKLSTDRDGNTLAEFYTHTEKLRLGKGTGAPPVKEKDTVAPPVRDTGAPPIKEKDTGTPSVKEVNYYSDWKLTKNITDIVKPGSTIFLKVVFSEPMRLKVADDETARPILYYQLNGKLNRFRIAKHGAGGQDFVSGDAKPLSRSSDAYICKYIVPADVTGELVAAVGKLSTDRDGNTLTEFYTHTEKLSIRRDTRGQTVGRMTKAPTQPPAETPAVKEQEPTTDITPLSVLLVEYYLNGDGTDPIDPETQFVWVGTPVFTKVVFSKPVTPVISSPINGKEERYRLIPRGETHTFGTCQPMNAEETVFLCTQSAQGEAFFITVTTDSADRDGNTLAEVVHSPILEVKPRQAVTPPTPEPLTPAPQPAPQPQTPAPQQTPQPQTPARQRTPEPPPPIGTPPTPEPPPPNERERPVPVELSNFRPARNKETGQVVITWSTQSELNNAGFFIKRSQQKDGEFKVINAIMIPGAGTTSQKQSYTYEDTTAQPNVVYYYQIEEISLDGDRKTLTRGIRLRGHVGAAGKATMTWGDLKAQE